LPIFADNTQVKIRSKEEPNLPEVLSSVSSLSGIVDDIEISKIRHPRDQLRNDRYEVSDLAASIVEKGLLQPIIVRLVADCYEIVAGNRRYEACKSIGWRKITCHIAELNDKEAFEIALVENIQRSTLSPIEEAKAFKTYISDQGWGGATQLAIKLGKSVSYVTKRIALLELPGEVIESINNSLLSSSAGEELCYVRDNMKQTKLAQLIAERHLSIRKIREIIEQVDDGSEDHDVLSINSEFLDDDTAYNYQKPIEKSILIMRMAMNKLGVVIDEIDEDCWPIREVLLQHKLTIHQQIDTLLKEKKKCDDNLVRLFKLR
jgi:ParB family chromosome partitioning protein